MKWLLDSLQIIGHNTLKVIFRLGQRGIFLWQASCRLPAAFQRPQLVFQQLHAIGIKTLIIIVVAGLFVGMVLGLQGYTLLVRFNAESSLGTMIGLSLVRELGPVVSALLFAGRAGSALTAEIGLMKTTEQLASLEMMGVNPQAYIIAPRLLASLIALPLLTAIFSSVGIFGGYGIGVGLLGVDSGAFWSQMQNAVDFWDDLINGVIKSVVFAVLISWLALFEGYNCRPSALGMSQATTRSVVQSSLAVLAANFILTAFMLDT